MGDVVNLNRYRKKRERAERRRRAGESRVKHGFDKSERALLKDQRERNAKLLDDKRLDRPDPNDPPKAG